MRGFHDQEKAVVSGAGGFIANHLVRRFKSEGFEVSTSSGSNFPGAQPRISSCLICGSRRTVSLRLQSGVLMLGKLLPTMFDELEGRVRHKNAEKRWAFAK